MGRIRVFCRRGLSVLLPAALALLWAAPGASAANRTPDQPERPNSRSASGSPCGTHSGARARKKHLLPRHAFSDLALI